MELQVPETLSPSKVTSFTECALAFRFENIDRIETPPTVAASKGKLVHAALERLMLVPAQDRSIHAGLDCLDEATAVFATDADFTGLNLNIEQEAEFNAAAEKHVRTYFALEDPATVNPIGLELGLEANLNGVRVRGIIDRLDLDEHGHLIVTDYKSGNPPPVQYEQQRLVGVKFYSYLCETVLGRRPAKIRLVYLGDKPDILTFEPTDQSTRGLERKLTAVWGAIETACATGDFQPNTGWLCEEHCPFKKYCPAFGGNPDEAAVAMRTPELVAA